MKSALPIALLLAAAACKPKGPPPAKLVDTAWAVVRDSAKSPKPELRAQAAAALVRLGDKDRAAELLTDKDLKVRMAAAQALAKSGDARGRDALLAGCKDKDLRTRAESVRALGDIGGPGAAEALKPMLKSEEGLERANAVHALGRIGNKAAVGWLLAIKDDQSDRVQHDLCIALTRLGDKTLIDNARTLTGDSTWRLDAAEALVLLGDPLGKQTFDDALGGVEGKFERIVAADRLADLGDKRGAPAILDALASKDPALRGTAVAVLPKLGAAIATKPLEKMVKDRDPGIATSAAIALAKLGDKAGRGVLAKAVTDAQKPGLRLAAAEALVMLLKKP